MPTTLWDVIAHGSACLGGRGLIGCAFKDVGSVVTVKKGNEITMEHSSYEGRVYQIVELKKNLPWNPNDNRTAIAINYGNGLVYTYLDERFNDELVLTKN